MFKNRTYVRNLNFPKKMFFRQKTLILMVVSTALLLDNMLFMVIVPIITTILYPDQANETVRMAMETNSILQTNMDIEGEFERAINRSVGYDVPVHRKTHFDTSQGSEDISIGVLFASKERGKRVWRMSSRRHINLHIRFLKKISIF